jgi:hypothetical protein
MSESGLQTAAGRHPPAIISLLSFSAGEAVTIAGTGHALQRQWRHLGYLPLAGAAHAQHDVFGLAELLALKMLSEKVGPPAARPFAAGCAAAIAWHALGWVDAWEGDHRSTLCWDAERFARVQRALRRKRSAVAAAAGASTLAETIERVEAEEGSRGWPEQCDWLRASVFHGRKVRPIASRFFLLLADGSGVFANSVDAALNSLPSGDARLAGGLVLADLESLGGMLVERAGRPFAHVEVRETENDNP